MSAYIVRKIADGLLICEKSIKLMQNIDVYQVKCSHCNQCEASNILCSNGRNELMCDYIAQNFQKCKQHAIKKGKTMNNMVQGIAICCDFNDDDLHFTTPHPKSNGNFKK